MSMYLSTVSSCLSSTDGPIVTPGCRPKPAFTPRALATMRSSSASATESITTTRLVAVQRWRDLPDRNRHREVPRRDDGHHPERLTHGVAEGARQLRGQRLAGQPPAFPGHELEHVEALHHLAHGLAEDLPFLQRQHGGQL